MHSLFHTGNLFPKKLDVCIPGLQPKLIKRTKISAVNNNNNNNNNNNCYYYYYYCFIVGNNGNNYNSGNDVNDISSRSNNDDNVIIIIIVIIITIMTKPKSKVISSGYASSFTSCQAPSGRSVLLQSCEKKYALSSQH
jgi:hypothetical protein